MKKNNNRRLVFVIVGLMVVGLVVVLGAVASVFAYRQFVVETDILHSSSLELRFIQSRDEGTAKSHRGVAVTSVEAESPAAVAGIQPGYVILALNGTEVNSTAELQTVVREHEVGETVTLTVDNGENQEDIEVTLASAGPYLGVGVAEGFQREGFGRLGIMPFADSFDHFDQFRERIPEGSPRFNPQDRIFPFDDLPEFPEGLNMPVIVFDIVPGSPADVAGIELGAVILELDGQTISSSDQLAELIGQMEPGNSTKITVQIHGDTETLDITLTAHPDDNERAYLGVYLGPDIEQFRQRRSQSESRKG